MENKSVALQRNETERNRSNKIMSEIVTTQNVLKNKFKQVLANRMEHENNLNRAMEPLRASIKGTETHEGGDSLRNLSVLKNTASQLRLATKSYLKTRPTSTTTMKKLADSENEHIKKNKNIIHNNNNINPNELCDRLRFLLTSQNAGNVNHVEEINTILAALHDLDIIV